MPVPVWFGRYESHGLSLSDDGTRAYVAKDANSGTLGLTILDTTQVQKRVPNPTVSERSFLTWGGVSIPQSTVPITIKGHPFVLESDEFGAQVQTGGARLIDISDDAHPRVVSNMRLAVMQKENFALQAGDPGVDTPFQFAQGYTGHFCNVPTRVDPPIVACGMSVSGLRIFDIRDPYHPKEVAYYNAPVKPRTFPEGSNWAYSSPTFVPERKEVWYSDAYTGFYAVRSRTGRGPTRTPRRKPRKPRCASRRVVTINVRGIPRGSVVRKLTVYVNGKRTKVQPGRTAQRARRLQRGPPQQRGARKKVTVVASLRKDERSSTGAPIGSASAPPRSREQSGPSHIKRALSRQTSSGCDRSSRARASAVSDSGSPRRRISSSRCSRPSSRERLRRSTRPSV